MAKDLFILAKIESFESCWSPAGGRWGLLIHLRPFVRPFVTLFLENRTLHLSDFWHVGRGLNLLFFSLLLKICGYLLDFRKK